MPPPLLEPALIAKLDATATPAPPTLPNPIVLTVDLLAHVCPWTPRPTLAARLPWIQRSLDLAGATTRLRAAAMVAQLAYESGWFKCWVEEPSDISGPHFEHYVGRVGNKTLLDAQAYIGRGFIQLTGRANYAAAGAALHLDLLAHPELATDPPENAARVAAWYWTSRDLNPLADVGDLATITRRINGALNGYSYREVAYRHALEALPA